jgi:hypothetical protein
LLLVELVDSWTVNLRVVVWTIKIGLIFLNPKVLRRLEVVSEYGNYLLNLVVLVTVHKELKFITMDRLAEHSLLGLIELELLDLGWGYGLAYVVEYLTAWQLHVVLMLVYILEGLSELLSVGSVTGEETQDVVFIGFFLGSHNIGRDGIFQFVSDRPWQHEVVVQTPSWVQSTTLITLSAKSMPEPIPLQHLCEPFVLILFLNFVEIFNSVARGAQLDEHHWGFFDGDVPVILEVENQLPDLQGDVLRVLPIEF